MSVAKLPYQEYVSINKRVPRLYVDLVFKKEGKLLLIKREIDLRKGQRHFPGGKILRGETKFEAVRRIGTEEAEIKRFNLNRL